MRAGCIKTTCPHPRRLPWICLKIVFTTGCDGQGRDWATYGPHRAGSATALARLLMAAGVQDQAWETRTATGTRSLFGPSLHGLAGLVAAEASLCWRRYRPFAGVSSSAAVSGVDLGAKMPLSGLVGAAGFGCYGKSRRGVTDQAGEAAGGASPPCASAPHRCAEFACSGRARLPNQRQGGHERDHDVGDGVCGDTRAGLRTVPLGCPQSRAPAVCRALRVRGARGWH